MAEELERIGLAGIFDIRDFVKNARKYATTLGAVNKKTDEAASNMTSRLHPAATKLSSDFVEMNGGVSKLATTLHEAGMSFEQIADFMGGSVAQIKQWTGAVQEQGQAVEETGKKVKTTTGFMDRYLRRLALWLTIGAAVRAIVSKISQSLSESFKKVNENSEAYKELNFQTERFSLAVAQAVSSSFLFQQALEGLNRAAKAAGELTALAAAEMRALSVIAQELAQGEDLQTALELGGVAGRERLKEIVDAMDMAGDETEELAKKQKDLAEILRQNDDELARHADRIREIHAAYREDITNAAVKAAEREREIIDDLQEEISDIRADASDDIAGLIAKHEKKISSLHEKRREDNENAEARHQARMAFMRKRFNLTRIQNERQYQARRRRLVGEGDVLAIEELDEQYELQRLAQEENFNLQMQQAEAMFRLQSRIQEEGMRRQVRIMQEALQDQIEEVKSAARERVQEAMEGGREEILANRDTLEEKRQDSQEERDRLLQDERQHHKDRMEAIAEDLREFAERYDMEFTELDRIVEAHWGPGSPMDLAVEGAFVRWKLYADQAARYIGATMGGAISGDGPSGGTGRRANPPLSEEVVPPASRGPGMQFGGSRVFNRRTLIPVAEGRPERVSAEPLNQGNLTMSLSWRGGPIELRGTGSLNSTDLSGVGSELTVAIASKMKDALDSQFSTRGR